MSSKKKGGFKSSKNVTAEEFENANIEVKTRQKEHSKTEREVENESDEGSQQEAIQSIVQQQIKNPFIANTQKIQQPQSLQTKLQSKKERSDPPSKGKSPSKKKEFFQEEAAEEQGLDEAYGLDAELLEEYIPPNLPVISILRQNGYTDNTITYSNADLLFNVKLSTLTSWLVYILEYLIFLF
jgi:hypothetical protein